MNKIIISATLLAMSGMAFAEVIPGTTLSIDMQAAQVQAGGRNVSMYRIPVTDSSTGKTNYYDATFQFGVLSDGSVGFSRTTSAAVSTSPVLPADNFLAGTYLSSAGKTYIVSGPSLVAGGRYSYSVLMSDSTTSTFFNATWITGTVAGHPLLSGINYTKPSDGASGAFGIMGSTNIGGGWCGSYVMGATQSSATTITLQYYGADFCGSTSYYAAPRTSFTITKQ